MPDSLVSACRRLHHLTGACEKSNVLLGRTNWISSRRSAQAEILAALYTELYDYLDRRAIRGEALSVEPARDYAAWLSDARDREYLAPVEELRDRMERLRNEVAGFYFHGSIATLDYVKGWSDFDDIVIVSESTVTDARRLADLERRLFRTTAQLFRFDPSQHHGHGILAEQELRHFPRTLFPPPIWQNSVRCFGATRIVLHVRDDMEDRLTAIHRLISQLRTFRGDQLSRPYVLKAYASAVMLLPSLYLQSQDVWCYKRDSFAAARGSFGAEWEAIEIASELRKSWHELDRRPASGRLVAMLWNPNGRRALNYISGRLPDRLKDLARALLPASQRFMAAIVARLEPVRGQHV